MFVKLGVFPCEVSRSPNPDSDSDLLDPLSEFLKTFSIFKEGKLEAEFFGSIFINHVPVAFSCRLRFNGVELACVSVENTRELAIQDAARKVCLNIRNSHIVLDYNNLKEISESLGIIPKPPVYRP